VDLRRYHPSGAAPEGLRNLSGIAVFNVAAGEGYTFDSLLEECRRQLREVAAECPGLGAYPKMRLRNLLPNVLLTREIDTRYEKIEAFCRAGGTANLPLYLSNAGLIDPARLSFAGATPVEASLVPLTYYYSYFFVYSTFAEQVTTSVGYCAAETSGPLLEKLFRAVDEQIDRVCAA